MDKAKIDMEKEDSSKEEVPETIICPNCGEEISIWQKRCPKCDFCLTCSV